MYTTYAATALALVACASALPQAPKASTNSGVPTKFVGTAQHTTTEIHNLPLVARQNAIWVGGDTAAYCPETGVPCPETPVTGFMRPEAIEDHGLIMNVGVPGGQILYAAKDGALSYTIAHSNVIPKGAKTEFFLSLDGKVQPATKNDEWFACAEDGGRKVYNVEKEGQDCIWFTFRTDATEGISAWQYE